jgi:hypothetical protein
VSAETLAPPLPQRTGVVALLSALAGSLVVLAALGVVYLAGGGSDSKKRDARHTFSAADHSFAISVPGGWTALRGAELAHTSGSPVAVLRRPDRRGVVIVRRSADLTGDLRTVAQSLTAQLGSGVAGFRLVSARVGRVRAGAAFLYTFVRGRTAQSLAVTRVKGVTYRIDSIVPAGSPEVARQAGAIVGSFGP